MNISPPLPLRKSESRSGGGELKGKINQYN
jgi:hypothetical protein